MPGPIQSGISNALTTSATIVGGLKHLEEEKAKTAAQVETTKATNALKEVQEVQAQKAEESAELEYKAQLAAGLNAENNNIIDEELDAITEKFSPLIDYRKSAGFSTDNLYEQAATEFGERAMSRIEEANKNPFRMLEYAYLNGEISNRQEYQRLFNKQHLKSYNIKNLNISNLYDKNDRNDVKNNIIDVYQFNNKRR